MSKTGNNIIFRSVDWSNPDDIVANANVDSGSDLVELDPVKGGIITRGHSKIYVFRNDLHTFPAESFQTMQIHGKNGAVLLSDKYFNNVRMIYDVVITEDFATVYREMMNALAKVRGYGLLYDTINKGEWYKACFHESTTPKVSRDGKTAKFQLVFDRTPERYTGRGYTTLRVTNNTANGTIGTGSTLPQYPMFVINSNGNTTLTIGNKSITVTGVIGPFVVDCETQEVYYKGNNYNNKTVLNSSEFPRLDSNGKDVTVTGVNSVLCIAKSYRL